MSIPPSSPIEPPSLQGALAAVLAVARAQRLHRKSLAARAGVRPETVTRAKVRGSIEWETLQALAHAAEVDLRVLAIPRRRVEERSSLADPSLQLAWSNPAAPTATLIAKAIERRSFTLILRAAVEQGIDTVAAVTQQPRAQKAVPERTLDFADRALRNIAIGAARVQPASID